jgi:hypothetical protein
MLKRPVEEASKLLGERYADVCRRTSLQEALVDMFMCCMCRCICWVMRGGREGCAGTVCAWREGHDHSEGVE